MIYLCIKFLSYVFWYGDFPKNKGKNFNFFFFKVFFIYNILYNRKKNIEVIYNKIYKINLK